MFRTVPGLGEIQGILDPKSPNVEQYNGIPYGSIAARFRLASLVTSWPENKWDGTKYGPICPFPKMVIGMGLTQQKLPPQHDYDMDEFKCLNLNITCPKGSRGTGYPVIVWVHGGGNCVGSGSDSGYNGAPLVEYSSKINTPTVVVTINYRLGAFGFLASRDISDDNSTAGIPGVGNYGLRDQLLAFEWVKKNIGAFGGDPNKITAAGQSAGSIDLHLLMCSELFKTVKPFSQAILASGVATLTVRSFEHQQRLYDKITTYLNLQNEGSSVKRLQALRDVPSEKLVNSYIALGAPVVSWQATVDGVFLKTLPKISNLPSQVYDPSIHRLLIGDAAHEGTIFAYTLRSMHLDYPKFQGVAEAALGPENAKELLQQYHIAPNLTPGEFFTNLTQLLTDAEWSHPIQTLARSFSNGDVFYYHVRDVNPFEGPNKGLSHHGVDLLFTFLTYQSYLPDKLAMLAEKFARTWLSFAAGNKPWRAYDQKLDGSSTIMYFGPDGEHAEAAESSKLAYENLAACEKYLVEKPYFVASLRGESIVE